MVLLLAAAPSVWAHGNPPDLTTFGDFGDTAAQCQEIIGRATERCVADAVTLQSRCLDLQMTGAACDTAASDAAAQAARMRARQLVTRNCTEQDAELLHFNSLDEATLDVSTTCSDLQTAITSAVYGPALLGGSTATAQPDPQQTCNLSTAHAAARLLRFVVHARRRALDRMAARPLPMAAKQALLARVQGQVATAHAAALARIQAACPDATFAAMYHRSADVLLQAIESRAQCASGGAYVQSIITCPAPVCGNGLQEPGEACDDGNTYDADACHNDCTKNNCTIFPSTFDLIQHAVFDNHGCSTDLCHGSTRQGGLDLRSDAAYDNLVDVPSDISPFKRVEPGDEQRSLLYLKLAAATLQLPGVPGSPMPQGLAPLSDNELEAMRRWIYAGAQRSGTVAGTADLLNACLPPPEPLQIRPPDPPAPGTGVQLHMAPWVLGPNSEHEVCFASYYDVSDQVPAEFRDPSGTNFRFKRVLTTQDPLSHHLIANLYTGATPPTDPVWGSYVCRGGAAAGSACDPLDTSACGAGVCATQPVPSVACIGFGPGDSQINFASFGFTGTQKTVTFNDYADGVYAEMPLRGIVLWNSHAFNLTDAPGTMEAWVNFYFAAPPEQQHPAQEIVDIDDIFGMHVPAFSSQEICSIEVLPDGAHLFELSSHMHRHGKRFRIFRGAFRCQGGANNLQACSPLSPDQCGGSPCADDAGDDANASLMYTSTIYNDPVVLQLDPPLLAGGTEAQRSLTYCGLYDNGAADPTQVKRQSTSPLPGIPGLGGPCATPTNCVSGKLRAACSGNTAAKRNASCDSSPDAHDGLCDACPLTGGVTTEDEMFVLLGQYYVP